MSKSLILSFLFNTWQLIVRPRLLFSNSKFHLKLSNFKTKISNGGSMLVLTRYLKESIVIGKEEAEITILRIDHEKNQVHIGIKAPKEMPVDRKEIFMKKKLSKKTKEEK